MCECRCEHVMEYAWQSKDQLGHLSSCSTLIETVSFVCYCACQTSRLPASMNTEFLLRLGLYIFFCNFFFLFSLFSVLYVNIYPRQSHGTQTISIHSEKSVQVFFQDLLEITFLNLLSQIISCLLWISDESCLW